MSEIQKRYSLSEIDDLTIQHMGNTENIPNDVVITAKNNSYSELKFYRKRITHSFKDRLLDLIQNKPKTNDINPIDGLIIRLSNEFIKDFKNSDFHESHTEYLKDSVIDISGLDGIENQPITQSIEETNQLLFNKKCETKNTLDNFVEKKTINLENPIQYPKLNPHNIKSKKFKYKGVKTTDKQS
jgi:hypothetical protein